MKWLGDKPLHTLLTLTERPGQWASWQIAPLPLVLAAASGLIWSRMTGSIAAAWIVALSLPFMGLGDWALLAALPRHRLSFGPVQPPWLGLALLRWLLALAALPIAVRWPFAAVLALIFLQALVWLLMAYGTLIEPFRLQVTHVEIPCHRFSNPGNPLRIVHLSDLHVERITRREQALAAVVGELEPDLIVLTGDFLSTSYNSDLRAVADLRSLLGQLRAPAGVYAVWGTPEVDLPDVLRQPLTDLGIVLLEDQAVAINADGHPLWLMGLSCQHDPLAEANRLRRLLAEAPPEACTILLYHTPDLMPQAASLGVDLFLAGHTHGGQWRLPGFGAIITSSRHWKRYEAGLYQKGRTYLYVSRGLGLEGFGAPRARFFCPPEVVLITLRGTGTAREAADV